MDWASEWHGLSDQAAYWVETPPPRDETEEVPTSTFSPAKVAAGIVSGLFSLMRGHEVSFLV